MSDTFFIKRQNNEGRAVMIHQVISVFTIVYIFRTIYLFLMTRLEGINSAYQLLSYILIF